MVQQSNCFIVVDRGMGLQNLKQERDLAHAGELRAGSNMGGGQMVTADFVLTPTVVFSEDDAGAIGGAVSGVHQPAQPLLGVRRQRSQVSGSADEHDDHRTRAAACRWPRAEGSTRKADLQLSDIAARQLARAARWAATARPNDGKIIAAALLDNFNKVVSVVRSDTSLQRNVGTLREEASRKAVQRRRVQRGRRRHPKIANVKLLATPSDSAESLATLNKAEESNT